VKTIKNIFDTFKTRYVRYGGYAAMITLATVLGLIFINLIVQQLSPQFDLTKNKLFSLSEQTLQVVDKLENPVTVYGLWEPGKETRQVKEVLDRYAARSKNFRLEIVDPDKNPGLISKYDKEGKGVDKGSLIVEGEKGYRIIGNMDLYDINYADPQNPQITGFSVEKRITGALLYVSAGVTPVIYEITGHKEKSLFDMGMKETVERENYSLKQLNLLQSDIPEDASCLILNGPKADFAKGEIDRILAYLEKGGRLFVLMDFQSGPAPNLNQLLAGYGIQWDFGVVVEMNKNYNTGNPFHAAPDLGSHEIVAPLRQHNTPVILQFAQGIRVLDVKRRTIEIEPLLQTSRDSFLRVDLSNNSPTLSGSDKEGPVLVAAAVKEVLDYQTNKETRLVAVGSGTVLEPLSLFGQVPGNIDLFMNSITWLQDRPESISVRSKSLITFPMNVTGLHIIIFGLLFVVLIPLAFFGAGLITWLKRRHL
jgi:ABC-type uncharacterized transport system involved in gliding motility auxiliary subunit